MKHFILLLSMNFYLWGNMIIKNDWVNPYRWSVIVCITLLFIIQIAAFFKLEPKQASQ